MEKLKLLSKKYYQQNKKGDYEKNYFYAHYTIDDELFKRGNENDRRCDNFFKL